MVALLRSALQLSRRTALGISLLHILLDNRLGRLLRPIDLVFDGMRVDLSYAEVDGNFVFRGAGDFLLQALFARAS